MRGMVRKSKNGERWRGAFKVRDQRDPSKWRQETRTFDTKREAEQWLRKRIGEYGGDVSDAGDTTVAEFLDEWFKFGRTELEESTQVLHLGVIKGFVGAYGTVKLRQLSTRQLDQWVRAMQEAHLAPATIQQRVRIIGKALRQAVRWNLIPTNPATNVSVPRGKANEIVPPTGEEVRLLLKAADRASEQFGMFVHLAVASGARRGELLALCWSDFEFEEGMMAVRKSMGRTLNNTEAVKSTKTGNTRSLSLDPKTLERLKAHRTKSGADGDDGPIFRNSSGERWKAPMISKRWIALRESVALDQVRFHDLRHYHATRLLSAGVDLPTVAGRLGHAGGGRTTLAVYGHWVKASDRHASKIIGLDFD